jgi:single-stranded-DNA-specific exonuclease
MFMLHNKKGHGISNDVIIPKGLDLLIVPDAGSGDIEQARELQNNETTVLVLDHHIVDQENPYACVVNCSTGKYPNPSLCGTGVVWKFLKAMDELLWENHADDFMDMIAFATIADSMDLKEEENKRIVDIGLGNINNKMLKNLIEKQSYSTNGIVNIQNTQYYLVPALNGLLRAGGYEEKQLLFKAFCQLDEWFDYEKRGSKEITQEDIYTRVSRLSTNAKAKQNREIDKYIEMIVPNIEKYGWNQNKIIFANAEELDGNYTGLVATKLSSIYNRPCFLMRPTKDDPEILSGSARNINNSPIPDLKQFVLDTGLFEQAQGHPNAFGISIKKKNIKEAIELTNNILKDWNLEQSWTVDFILDSNDITEEFIDQCLEAKKHSFEAIVLIKDVFISTRDIQLIGKESNTMKFEFTDVEAETIAEAIKFKMNENEPILQIMEDWSSQSIRMDMIVKISENYYNGIFTKQLIILEYELK